MNLDKVFFVKIRNQHDPNKDIYPSYSDYWRFVELSGFKICELEEVQPDSDNTYIFAPNIYVPDAVLEGTARTILYQLERPTDLNNVVGGRPFWDERYNEIWIYDRSLLLLNPPATAKYVIFGGHKDFIIPMEVEKKYDFYHMSYLHGRRHAKVVELQNMGFTMADTAYPHDIETKSRLIQESRYGLCLHQDELKYIEPIRYTVFSCGKLPLFPENHFNSCPYAIIPLEVKLNLQDWGEIFIEEIVNQNYRLMTEEYTFRNCVIAALLDKELL